MEKANYALELLRKSIDSSKRAGVGCSFGKDSVTTVHLARQIDPNISVFSIMTLFKPRETFEYLVKINQKLDLNVKVFMVSDKIPSILANNEIKVQLLSLEEYNLTKNQYLDEIYNIDTEECCRLLKVGPIKEAVKDYDILIDGLRSSEGITRQNLEEVEYAGGMMKIHPILHFTEADIFQYLRENNIPIHPWYEKTFPNGRRYRSLGCAPCTRPIFNYESERDGRWQGSNKKGGECGIHTNQIKENSSPTSFGKKFIVKSNIDKKTS